MRWFSCRDMSLEKILAPLKFVENEIESVVESIYSKYNEKTGNDQFQLSNTYFVGWFVMSQGQALFNNDFVLSNEMWVFAGIFGAITGGICFFNNMYSKMNKTHNESNEGTKNSQVALWQNSMKFLGRLGMGLATFGLISKYIDPNSSFIDAPFGAIDILCYTLSGYTAAIDTNNPKKSKILEKARDLFSYKQPVKVTSTTKYV